MGKKIFLAVGVIIAAALVVLFSRQSNPLLSPLSNKLEAAKKVLPSDTLKEYSDPSGFTINYPDNLSISKNEDTDTASYADLTLSSKDVNGSLNLKISDSKFKSIDEWLALNKAAAKGDPKEIDLGDLKAMELITSDRLLLGALDKDVLFTIEIPLVEQDFWMKVYSKVLTSFSFTSPTSTAAQGDGGLEDDVSFEGEEVVE